jgi:hypothetical protein
MAYFIMKTRESPQAARIFYILKQEAVPIDEQKNIIHLGCASVRRFKGITQLLQYLEQNTSNALHETEPYILRKISWNEAVDMFGFDNDTDVDTGETTEQTAE